MLINFFYKFKIKIICKKIFLASVQNCERIHSSLPTSPTDSRLTNLTTYLDTVLEADDNYLTIRSKKSFKNNTFE